MVKKLNKHAVFILSMLVAYLIKDLVFHVLGDFKNMGDNAYKSVGIGMLIVALVFYPLYELLKELGEKLLSGYLKETKRMTKSNFLGLLLGFAIAIAILYGVYAYVWFGINVVKDLKGFLG